MNLPIPSSKPSTTPSNAKFSNIFETLPVNRAAEMLRYGQDKPNVITIAQGEGSKATPEFITNAAFVAAKEGKTFYTPPLGIPELRSSLSNYYQRIYGFNIPDNRIFVTASGTAAVHLALASIIEDGDEVIAITPIWKNLLGAISVARGRVTEVSLTCENNQWSLDMDKLFDSVSEKTKAIMLVTPSNPTGWVMNDDEIKQIVEFARARDIWIIADEVYGRMVYNGQHAPSFLSHTNDDDKVFVVNSFSKAWSMTGWRMGWLVGPSCAEEKIRDLAIYNYMAPTSFSQFGAIAALEHGEEHLKSNLALWRRNRQAFIDTLSKYNSIQCPIPEATFYGFFKVEKEPDCFKFTKRLIDDAGVSLAPGFTFGHDFKGWMRICFAVSEEIMDEALIRLEKGISGI